MRIKQRTTFGARLTLIAPYRLRLIVLRVIALIIAISSINSSEIWAGTPGIYHEQGLTMTAKIDDVLIKYQYCKDKNDCTKRRLRFFLPTSTGIVITTYQIEEPKVIQEIMAACVSVYEENQQKMNIGLGMYREPHERVMGIFAQFYKKPFISLSLRGAQP